MARPFKYDWDKVVKDLKQYINNTDDPQLKEFCLSDEQPSYDHINEVCKENTELNHTVKQLIQKQEVFLSRAKDINPIMAIFRLKQPVHGYRDKQEIDHSVEQKTIIVNMIGDIND